MWQEQNDKLFREFVFKDFDEAFRFMESVAKLARQQNHHPRWTNEWNNVQIWLSTHEAGDKITANDEELSKAIDDAYQQVKKANTDDIKTTIHNEIKIYTDGVSRGNPGPSASGFVLIDMKDNIISEHGVYLGITTNNQAEYQALKLSLDAAQALGARELNVYMDSLLIVNQMLGKFKVKNMDLLPIYEAIKEQIKGFKRVSFTHVPRELNKLADAMVNKALDEHLSNSA